MAHRQKKIDLFANPPPGGLEEAGTAVLPKNPPPPEPAPSAAAAASLQKDKLTRSLRNKRTQTELQQTSGQQGSLNRRKQQLEDEAQRFRRSRR